MKNRITGASNLDIYYIINRREIYFQRFKVVSFFDHIAKSDQNKSIQWKKVHHFYNADASWKQKTQKAKTLEVPKDMKTEEQCHEFIELRIKMSETMIDVKPSIQLL